MSETLAESNRRYFTIRSIVLRPFARRCGRKKHVDSSSFYCAAFFRGCRRVCPLKSQISLVHNLIFSVALII